MTTTTPTARIEQENFHHLVMDIAWVGLALAATTRFLQFYAIRMGATPMDLGWITSLPAVILVIATLLSNRWRRRYADSVHAVWWPAFAFRFVFLLPAFAPFFPQSLRVPWIILAATLPALPQGLNSSIFVVMMREVVDEEHLTPLFTRRTFAMNIAVTIGALVFGLLLELLPFPINYQVMFVAAFGFSMVSQWHLGRLQVLEYAGTDAAQPTRPRKSARQLLKSVRFQSVAFITLIGHVAFFSVHAVTPLRLQRDLGATELFQGAFSVAELLAAAAIAVYIPRIVRRIGNRTMIAYGLVGTALAAMMMALAHDLWPTLIAAAVSGASWTMVGVGTLGFFAERTDRSDMNATMIFHQMVFAAMFVGPLLGSSLANAGLNLSLVLLGGAVLRLVAAWLTMLGLAVFRGHHRIPPLRGHSVGR
jgi:MFS family permease